MKNFWIFLLFSFLALGATACTTTRVQPNDPTALATLGYNAGYIGYFSGNPATQTALKDVCLLDTTQDPAQVATNFYKILSAATAAAKGLNKVEQASITLAIQNLTTALALGPNMTDANVNPDLIAAIQGTCQGVESAENVLAEKAMRNLKGKLGAFTPLPTITVGKPPALVAPPLQPKNQGFWHKFAHALKFWDW